MTTGGNGAPRPEPGRGVGSRFRRAWSHPLTRLATGLVVVAIVVIFVARSGARHDVATTIGDVSGTSIPWLILALAAEAVSFYCYASVQRQLLLAGGARLSRRAVLGLAVASTGLTNLVPGGVAPAGGWLVGQYRRRGIPMPLALWSVLAGGVTATVSVLGFLLVGAGIAGLVPAWVVALGAVLIAGVTGVLVLAVHRVGRVDQWLDRHPRLRERHLVQAALTHAATAARFRAGLNTGAQAYALSAGNWLMDVVVLVSAFLVLGLPVPWTAVLFAYAVAQVAGSLTPLPGGIGVVEGGMVGGFALAGVGAADALVATIVYRVVTCWLVAAVGSVALVVISRREHVEPARLHGAAASLGRPSSGTGGEAGETGQSDAEREEEARPREDVNR